MSEGTSTYLAGIGHSCHTTVPVVSGRGPANHALCSGRLGGGACAGLSAAWVGWGATHTCARTRLATTSLLKAQAHLAARGLACTGILHGLGAHCLHPGGCRQWLASLALRQVPGARGWPCRLMGTGLLCWQQQTKIARFDGLEFSPKIFLHRQTSQIFNNLFHNLFSLVFF